MDLLYRTVCNGCTVCTGGTVSPVIECLWGGDRLCCAGSRLSRTEVAVLVMYNEVHPVHPEHTVQYIHCISSELTGPEPDQPFPPLLFSPLPVKQKKDKRH
jgi:hypothetical protein